MEVISLKRVIDFLNRLEEAHIYYRLLKSRDFSITVFIDVPGQRWEVDFLYENDNEECSGVWVEKFISDGVIFKESELDVLFRDFSD